MAIERKVWPSRMTMMPDGRISRVCIHVDAVCSPAAETYGCIFNEGTQYNVNKYSTIAVACAM